MRLMKYTLLTVLALSAVAPAIAAQDKERHCMALNIYFEARNQTATSAVAVGFVVLNRVASKRFPNTVCKVVWQRKQFSWTLDGKSDRPREKAAWETAQILADTVMSGHYNDPTNGALFYHANYVKPYWMGVKMKVSAKLGSHIFYR